MELKLIIIGYALAIIIVSISGIMLINDLPPLPPAINIFSCQDNLDCQVGEKCQDNKCADVGCVGNNETIPGAISPMFRDHMATQCCYGLKQIDWPKNYDDNCQPVTLVGAPAGVCSDCGNYRCEGLETKCNCPIDCKPRHPD